MKNPGSVTQEKRIPHLHYGHMYEDDKYARLRIKNCAELLLPFIKNTSKVLEIGCYTAEILDYLPENTDYTGIDFDVDATKFAKQKGAKIVYVNFDKEEINLSDKFDIIICAEVLEHLIDPPAMMKKIKELLKNDGVVLLSLPNENTIYHRIMSLLGYGVDMCAFQLHKHLHLPTTAQNEAFVAKYFKIVKKTSYINPSAKSSRSEWIGSIATLIPDGVWVTLANTSPGLFARGIVFLARNY